MDTKVSQNFDVREFVSRAIYEQPGINPRWFVSEKQIKYAEFLKSFLTTHFKKKLGNDKVKTVLVVINNWHTGGPKQYSGFREPKCTEGASLSQHRFVNAIDTELFIVFNDGTKQEVDYKEIHEIIHANEAEFMANGLTTIEDVAIATGWLHSDFRFTGLDKLLIVKP